MDISDAWKCDVRLALHSASE